jgi:hypothetical protein
VASVVANITEDTANMTAAMLAESADPDHTVKKSTPIPAKAPPSVQPNPRDIVLLRLCPVLEPGSQM